VTGVTISDIYCIVLYRIVLYYIKDFGRLQSVDVKNIEPMSDESSLAANHVTKLPGVLFAQSQQLAASHAYYNYLLTSNARDVHFAAAHAQSQHRDLLNG